MTQPKREAVEMFVRVLGIDEPTAESLAAAELTTIEEVAYMPWEELSQIEGLAEGNCLEIRRKAREYLLP